MIWLQSSVLCSTPEEFSQKLNFAMKHEPKPMKAEERDRLTWEAATERFLDVAELRGEERATKVSAAVDTLAFNLYNYLTGVFQTSLTFLKMTGDAGVVEQREGWFGGVCVVGGGVGGRDHFCHVVAKCHGQKGRETSALSKAPAKSVFCTILNGRVSGWLGTCT